MTDRLQASVALPVALKERLSADDDPVLWEQVVGGGSPLYAEVGGCSHWLRPHQTLWTAAGGFAWRVGFG